MRIDLLLGEKESLPYDDIKRDIIVLKEDETDYKYGKRPEERSLEEAKKFGIINFDKPSGLTSHETVYKVKKIIGVDKAGHSGTLDPKVTGVLPIALNKAVSLIKILLLAGKEYVALAHFHKEISKEKIIKSFSKFVGTIDQLPPVRSHVKRRWRKRKIYYIKILEIEGKDVLFKVGCEAGTYIRKLIHDIGIYSGAKAHMIELRRTRVANFFEEESIDIYKLADAVEKGELRKYILPPEKIVEILPKVWISDKAVGNVTYGSPVFVPGIVKLNDDIKEGDLVAIMSLKDEIVALGIAKLSSEEIERRKKGVAFFLNRVIMPRGIYPRK